MAEAPLCTPLAFLKRKAGQKSRTLSFTSKWRLQLSFKLKIHNRKNTFFTEWNYVICLNLQNRYLNRVKKLFTIGLAQA
jgi:hypothetical protein